MITYCSNCQTNWAALHTCEGDGDEQYEVCPVCRTDMFLEEGTDIVAYILNPITGQVLNVLNGEEREVVKDKPRFRVRLQPPAPEKSKWEMLEEKEDAAIDAYQATGSKQAYFEAFKK